MMKKKLYLFVCLCTLLSGKILAQDTLARQCFEGISTQWSFTGNPSAYNVSGDIWDTISSLGEINPYEGSRFWGIQDLDNNNGGGNFFHLLEFESILLTGYVNNMLSFRFNVIAFDAGDKVQLDISLNGVLETVDVLNGASGGVSTNGWEEFQFLIPDSVHSITVTLKAKQNGGTDQAGWDHIMITGYPEGSLPLTAAFTTNIVSCFSNDTIVFTDNSWGGTSPYLHYWDFDNDGLIDDTATNPLHCYSSPGVYSPALFITDVNGDTSSLLLVNLIEVGTYPNVWINEIHYDDNSKDTDEGVEVILQDADCYDINKFTISLYNGNNGTVYNSETMNNFLPGVTIEGKTLFHHFFSSMQNGAPDGVALDYDGNLIEFLSYEGSFEATEGPALGATSTNIGVGENSSTPTGTSIQLLGVGEKKDHFYWVTEQLESFGNCNTGQYLSWPEQTTWTGNGSSWMCPECWNNGIPGPGTDVLLDTGASEYPQLLQDRWCHSIIINDGGYLFDTAGFLHVEELITVNKVLTGGVVTDDPENAIYHFLGSPVSHCSAINAMPPDAYVRRYNESTQSWENITGNDTLTPGTGYSVYLPSEYNQITFSDSSTNSNVSYQNLSLSGDITSYSGFHLLSNPYLSPIDWDLLQKENIAQTVYVWYNGDYLEWNGIVGNLSDGIIPVAQGFFVQVTDEQNAITFPNSALIPVSSSILKENNNHNALEISLHFNDREDNAFLAFADDATTSFDTQYDALKLNSQSYHPGICIIQNNIRYAICFTPVDTSADFCMGFKAPDDGEYTFMFNGKGFMDKNDLYLKDNYTNKTHDLSSNPVIDFYADAGEYDDRFVLTQSPVGLDEQNVNGFKITQKNSNLIIHVDEASDFLLWSADGRIIIKKKLTPGETTIPLRTGVYIINIQQITKKIIIL